MEEDSLNSYITLINELSNKPGQLYIQLSRSLFISPYFTKFVHQFLYFNATDNYILNYKSCDQIVIENIRRKILNSFLMNIDQFPLYLSLFLHKIENKSLVKEIFKRAFCEELIENPSIFFANDFWIIESNSKSEEISNFLRDIFNDQMIDSML